MIHVSKVRLNNDSRLVLRSGKEVEPVWDFERAPDGEWYACCYFGFLDRDGFPHHEEVALSEVVAIRGATVAEE